MNSAAERAYSNYDRIYVSIFYVWLLTYSLRSGRLIPAKAES